MFLNDVVQFRQCTGEIEVAYVRTQCIQLRLFNPAAENTLQSTKRLFRIAVALLELTPQSSDFMESCMWIEAFTWLVPLLKDRHV